MYGISHIRKLYECGLILNCGVANSCSSETFMVCYLIIPELIYPIILMG
jgi:hypothetical protein